MPEREYLTQAELDGIRGLVGANRPVPAPWVALLLKDRDEWQHRAFDTAELLAAVEADHG